MSLTRDLARLIRAKPVSDTDLQAAALFTLDAVANILGGRNSGPGRVLMSWAGEQGHVGGNRGGDARAMTFLMGGLCHILEMDDLHRASVVHPGCVVVPAVLAQSAAMAGPVDGVKALTAVLHGFEATTRVGMAVGPTHYKIWHNTATCGAFGSAMAAGLLLDLDEDQCVHALGNAGTQASGLWEFLDSGAMSKHLHAGRAAESGLTAAQLAKHGFTGPATILEGRRGFFAAACPDADPARITADPDAPWQVHATSIKPWPSCRHTHPAIGAAIDLRAAFAASGCGLDDIAGIAAETYPAAIEICDRQDVDSVYAAKFSLQHCIAAALAFDRVDFDSFEAGPRDHLADLRRRITPEISDDFAGRYPRSWGCGLKAVMRDGTTFEAECTDAKGDPEAALDRDEMVAKARMLLRHGDVPMPDNVIDSVLAMADGGPAPQLVV
jgi:2-methylcitrate dehydratase PrpD